MAQLGELDLRVGWLSGPDVGPGRGPRTWAQDVDDDDDGCDLVVVI